MRKYVGTLAALLTACQTIKRWSVLSSVVFSSSPLLACGCCSVLQPQFQVHRTHPVNLAGWLAGGLLISTVSRPSGCPSQCRSYAPLLYPCQPLTTHCSDACSPSGNIPNAFSAAAPLEGLFPTANIDSLLFRLFSSVLSSSSFSFVEKISLYINHLPPTHEVVDQSNHVRQWPMSLVAFSRSSPIAFGRHLHSICLESGPDQSSKTIDGTGWPHHHHHHHQQLFTPASFV